MKLPSLPREFLSTLRDLTAPDMFSMCLTEADEREIYGEIMENPRQYGVPCETYLAWRDAIYDAMLELGYDLPTD